MFISTLLTYFMGYYACHLYFLHLDSHFCLPPVRRSLTCTTTLDFREMLEGSPKKLGSHATFYMVKKPFFFELQKPAQSTLQTLRLSVHPCNACIYTSVHLFPGVLLLQLYYIMTLIKVAFYVFRVEITNSGSSHLGPLDQG